MVIVITLTFPTVPAGGWAQVKAPGACWKSGQGLSHLLTGPPLEGSTCCFPQLGLGMGTRLSPTRFMASMRHDITCTKV